MRRATRPVDGPSDSNTSMPAPTGWITLLCSILPRAAHLLAFGGVVTPCSVACSLAKRLRLAARRRGSTRCRYRQDVRLPRPKVVSGPVLIGMPLGSALLGSSAGLLANSSACARGGSGSRAAARSVTRHGRGPISDPAVSSIARAKPRAASRASRGGARGAAPRARRPSGGSRRAWRRLRSRTGSRCRAVR